MLCQAGWWWTGGREDCGHWCRRNLRPVLWHVAVGSPVLMDVKQAAHTLHTDDAGHVKGSTTCQA